MKFVKISILFLFVSCTVKIPDIQITGEKTALENQVMGEYTRIREDAWMIASERGDGRITVTADRKDVVEAVRDREFNRDDVNEYKTGGIFGENRNGLLEITDASKLDGLTEKRKTVVRSVLEKENRARKLIMDRIISTDARYSRSPGEVYSAFFIMNLEESPDNTYYRSEKGEWNRK